MPPTNSGKNLITNGSTLTFRWLAGILLFVLFATVGSVWALQASTVRENHNDVAENKAELAVMRAQIAHIDLQAVFAQDTLNVVSKPIDGYQIEWDWSTDATGATTGVTEIPVVGLVTEVRWFSRNTNVLATAAELELFKVEEWAGVLLFDDTDQLVGGSGHNSGELHIEEFYWPWISNTKVELSLTNALNTDALGADGRIEVDLFPDLEFPFPFFWPEWQL